MMSTNTLLLSDSLSFPSLTSDSFSPSLAPLTRSFSVTVAARRAAPVMIIDKYD